MSVIVFRNAADKKHDDLKDTLAVWMFAIAGIAWIGIFVGPWHEPGHKAAVTITVLAAGAPAVMALCRFFRRAEDAKLYERGAEVYYDQCELTAKIAKLAEIGRITPAKAIDRIARQFTFSDRELRDSKADAIVDAIEIGAIIPIIGDDDARACMIIREQWTV
jgi:hypothetical protein